MKHQSFIGIGLVAIGTLAGGVFAAAPSKTDMDFCNHKAAQVSKASPVQPGQTAPSPTGGGTSQPGTPVSPSTTGTQQAPGTGSPQPGSNPTGGRVSDSSQPGTPPSELGMASIGETDPGYRQAYLACINERTK